MLVKHSPENVYVRPNLIMRFGYWLLQNNHLEQLLLPITVVIYLSLSMAVNYTSIKDYCPLQNCESIKIETIGDTN